MSSVDITALHRAHLVASLRESNALTEKVQAHIKARDSMLPDDIAAALKSDREWHLALAESEAVGQALFTAQREDIKGKELVR